MQAGIIREVTVKPTRLHILLALLLVTACVALAAPMARADDGAESPAGQRAIQQPYRVFLPVIMRSFNSPVPQTAVFQQGNAGYTGASDTFISAYGDPYAAHGFEPIIAVRWERSQNKDVEAGLVRFDLTSIPTTATIQSATLSLWVSHRNNINPMTLSAYRLLHDWVSTEASWYNAKDGLAWFALGANGIGSDRDGAPAASAAFASEGIWIDLPIVALAQGWVRNPASNFGVTLKPTGDVTVPSVRYELASSRFADLALRPKLSVTYLLWDGPKVVTPGPFPPTRTPTQGLPTATPTQTAPPTATATPSPTWTPAPSWWNTSYQYRRRLSVSSGPGATLEAGYAVSLTLNSDLLVGEGKLRSDRQDWRLVAWDGVTWREVDRDAVGAQETWFSTVKPLPENSRDDEYYVYYGNPAESQAPPQNKDNVYGFFDDFDSYDASKWPALQLPSVVVASGLVTVTAYNSSGGAADSCPFTAECMLSQKTFGIGYQVELRAQHPDYVYQKKHDADHGFSDDGHTHEAKLRSYGTGQFERVNRNGEGNYDIMQCCRPADTEWHTFRISRLTPGSIVYQIDSLAPVSSTLHIPQMALPVHIRAYSEEPFEPSRNVVDWIKVRRIVPVEPAVAFGPEEEASFTFPTPTP